MNPGGRPADLEKRALAESLAAKYGLSVRVVREHLDLFSRGIPDHALMCLIKDMRPKKGGYDH